MRIKSMVFSAAFGFAAALLSSSSSFAVQQETDSKFEIQNFWDSYVAKSLEQELKNKPRTSKIIRRDRAALLEFYKQRNFKPLWTTDGILTPKAHEIASFLSAVDEYGLDPEAYKKPDMGLGLEQHASAKSAAEAEIKLSLAILAYARHAYAGRVHPSKVDPSITYKPKLPDPIKVMEDLQQTEDLKEVLVDLNPPHPQFDVLRKRLMELRDVAKTGGWPTIDAGKTIKPGMIDERVATLKQRFDIPMPPPLIADPNEVNLYDGEIIEAVKKFQHEHGLEDDGIIGPATLSQLNKDVHDRIYQLLANLEQWRWITRDLGDFHVFVDIPGFRVRVMKDDEVTHETRVVVGKKRHQTPIFSDQFEYLVVNPYWNVPRSIATEEMLPEIQSDPNYFARRNFEVLPSWGNGNKPISPQGINWTAIDPSNFPYRFRQPPGRGNALGSIKFMFPNKHSVYLHDTPSKSLFNRTSRMFSHGCVRVHKPMEFAGALLQLDPKLNAKIVKKNLNSGENRTLSLTRKIPVHLTYFTAWVEGDEVMFRNDIYEHDLRVAGALGWR